ncbi:MFS transporter [Oceanicoccus sp. KOV_DT_Chl]|uniref:spinster family MFS transporter n=1 Tax=Oceanicoccus sp. KOV_DT_Chl TaxID=1904639 RepID=UPI000C7A90F0|nr:MFS transporter [Oceanicoccus sp. KOV_DT_Chl]
MRHTNEKSHYSRQGYYALMVLLLAYILSFIDRNIMAVLVGPVRESFAISDFQFSLLHGAAFTLFYIFLGLPIGWLADRVSRKYIIMVGVFFWSVMTFLCGLADSFLMLFLIRIGVGVGEAALSPPAYSLFGDYFTPQKLRWATAIFSMGITIGTGLSYKLGGFVYDWFSNINVSEDSIIREFMPWQMTFMVVAVPGFFIVGLLAFMREPTRFEANNVPSGAVPVTETFAHLYRQWQAYGALFFGVSMMSVIGYGTMTWFPEFLMRSYGLERAEASRALGNIFLLAGTAGSLAGAGFACLLQRLGYDDANVRWVMLVAAVLVVPATVMPQVESADTALMIAWCVVFLHYTHFGVAMAALQLITPSRMRALTSALMLFMTNLFGLALGGTVIAFVTDFVFGYDQALRYSLSWVAGVVYPLAAVVIGGSLHYYRTALRTLYDSASSKHETAFTNTVSRRIP